MSITTKLVPFNLQFFGGEDVAGTEPAAVETPQNVDVAGLNAILDGTAASEVTTPDVAEPEVTEPEVTEPEVTEPEVPLQDKANAAFAQMRVQNSAMSKLLGTVAQAAGIEYTNTQDLLTKLNDDAISKLAQKQNVPVELLQRMQVLEARDAQYQQSQLKEAALVGFQNLQTEFGLNQSDLNAFAQELDAAELNPFNTAVDLKKEYISRHYAEITDKKIQAAVEAALKADQRSATTSTTPNTAAGTGADTPSSVTTVQGLNALLDQNSK